MTIIYIIVFFPIFVLFSSAVIIVLLRMLRPDFVYSWLIAAASSLISFIAIIVIHNRIPIEIPLVSWDGQYLLTLSPELLIDEISWSYALALTGLAVAIIFTDVARAAEADWSAWASSLTFIALGLMAVYAGNLMTLALVWAAIDFMELLILLWHVSQSDIRERVIISFSARAGGIFLLLIASIVLRGEGNLGLFSNLDHRVSIYLLIACGLRLGILPLHIPFIAEPPLRRSLGTALRIVPAATSYLLVTRTAYVQNSAIYENLLLLLLAIAALYGAYYWVITKDVLDARPYWIIGSASLVLASAIREAPTASLAWGVTSLLAGSLLFLNSAPHRRLQPIIGLGLLVSLPFPFFPAWDGSRLYYPMDSILLLPLLFAQSLLVVGYIRQLMSRGLMLDNAERWVWIIYPLGLLVLPVTHVIAMWFGRSETARIIGEDILIRLLSSLLMLGFVWLWIYVLKSRIKINVGFNFPLRTFFSLEWLYRFLWFSYRYIGRGIGYISYVIEGEGGIIWALLMLILILAFFLQV